MTSKFLKPKTLQEQVAAQEARAQARDEQRLRQTGRTPTDGETGWLTLGAHLEGDLLPDHLGIQSRRGGYCSTSPCSTNIFSC